MPDEDTEIFSAVFSFEFENLITSRAHSLYGQLENVFKDKEK